MNEIVKLTTKEQGMQIEKHLFEEAEQLLQREGVELPVALESAPSFWVAQATDNRVVAFNVFEFGGQSYKIGFLKPNE